MHVDRLPLRKIFLWQKNPRFEEVMNEDEAIDALVKHEKIDALARDIERYGLSPVERLLVFPIDQDDPATGYVAADGNRRLCALKLLSDPDRAPKEYRDTFEALADQWAPIKEVDVAIVEDAATRDHWLRRLHDGEQAGKGRRSWSTDQKSRFTGGGRNKLAVEILDYSVRRELITSDERKGTTSHLDRILRNPSVKELLGLKVEGEDRIAITTRNQAEFDRILASVLNEAKTKSLGSQASSDDIKNWAQRRRSELDPSNEFFEPREISGLPSDGREKDREKREKSGGSSRIEKSSVVLAALDARSADKLRDLYESLSGISVKTHPLLISVGIWTFFESLGALLGKKSGNSFADFFNATWMESKGLGTKRETKGISAALRSFADRGNITKHDAVAAHYDSKQMINDMKVATPLIIAAANEITNA